MACAVMKGVLEAPDGVIVEFTLPSDYIIGSTQLFINGILTPDCHVEGPGRTVILGEAPLSIDEVCFFYLEI